MTNKFLTISETAKLLGKSTETLRRWDKMGKLAARREPISNYRIYKKEQLNLFSEIMAEDDHENEAEKSGELSQKT